jgi:beta-glucosidase
MERWRWAGQRRAILAVLLGVGLTCGGGTGGPGGDGSPRGRDGGAPSGVDGAADPDASGADGSGRLEAAPPVMDGPAPAGEGFVPSAACQARVATLLARMTLEQKAGQVLMIERKQATPAQATRFGLGGVLTAADASVQPNTPTGWADEVDRYHRAALASASGVPMFYAIDAVHGNAEVRGSVVFPHNIGLGATNDPALVEQVGRIVALEMAGIGLDVTFGPMVAVARDDRWGRENESFGETPELAGRLGAAFIRGLQGRAIGSGPAPIIGTAKHFVADGATRYGTAPPGLDQALIDRGDAVLDEATLLTLHGKPYELAIAAGVGSVMATYSRWNGTPVHSSKKLLTDVLKTEMGFRGFVISDFEGIEETASGATAADRYAGAFNAGIDMVMSSGETGIAALIALIEGLVPARVPRARFDDQVGRILLTKCMMGLLDGTGLADRTLTAAVGAADHRAVGRQAVRQSLVLLENKGGVLPLSRSIARLHLGGKSADSMANQCGGWTIDWQGKAASAAVGTTVRQAIEAVVTPARVTFAADGTGGAGAAVGIAVIGETPYAEWFGDRADLSLDPADVAAVRAMKDAGLRTVVVLISGRPLILDPILPLADAIVAAWLPGTEAAGIADILFGDARPTGKLPQSWPRTMAQIPVNSGDASYDPLYPYGHGLTYP